MATRAQPTSCTTIPRAPCATSGSSTTSRARWRGSAKRACRRSWPSGCAGENEMANATPTRVSTLDHWESYWKGHADLDRTYSTGGRLAREGARELEVSGRRGVEVGRGAG